MLVIDRSSVDWAHWPYSPIGLEVWISSAAGTSDRFRAHVPSPHRHVTTTSACCSGARKKSPPWQASQPRGPLP